MSRSPCLVALNIFIYIPNIDYFLNYLSSLFKLSLNESSIIWKTFYLKIAQPVIFVIQV